MMSALLFSTVLRVEFEDLDAGGVVHHPNYLKICERARSLWLEPFAADFVTLKANDIALAVRGINAEYRKPIAMGNARVEIHFVSRKTKVLVVQQKIFALDGRFASPEKENFRAEFTLVAMNYSTSSACDLPQSVLRALETTGG